MSSGSINEARREAIKRAKAHSPFLRETMALLPQVLDAFADEGAEAAVRLALEGGEDDVEVALRRQRLGLALAAALGDLAGEMPLESVTAVLSDFADRAIDRAMIAALPASRLATLPVRERIRTLVEFRLDAIASQVEALRRALAVMAAPRHAAEALRLGWASADAMWRLAGDTATDYNHYSKRAILGAIYAATLTVFANDESEGRADTRAFLDRRIGEVMKFEKTKAQLLRPGEHHFSMARFLGRLRYPAR